MSDLVYIRRHRLPGFELWVRRKICKSDSYNSVLELICKEKMRKKEHQKVCLNGKKRI